MPQSPVFYSREFCNESVLGKLRKEIQFALKSANLPESNLRIAIKTHLGEPGNKYFLKPDFIKPYVEVAKKFAENGEVTFIETPVAYPSPRNTILGHAAVAKLHGFEKLAKVVITKEPVNVQVNGRIYGVAKPLTEADLVLVISHVKGHGCAGFGAAIKNLGMGALTKGTKEFIHSGSGPVYKKGCIGCGECAKVCPASNIKIKKTRNAKTGMVLAEPVIGGNCFGCSKCCIACKHKALVPKIALFDQLLAEGAFAAMKSFRSAVYVNVLKDITDDCDCMKTAKLCGMPDLGILISRDIVAIDQASMDLINKNAGYDFFEKLNGKSPRLQIEVMKSLTSPRLRGARRLVLSL